jgi:flavin reductase (DIM6/NTAB) family NADH-FMN oxidoreductase RutF
VIESSGDWDEQDLASGAFRHTMGLFPTGVAVLAAGDGEGLEATTVNSVVSASLVPLLVLVSLRRGARILGLITSREQAFTVNILAADQEQVARMFARSDRCRGTAAAAYLRGVPTRTGGLLVAGALAAVQCELDQVYPAGDHDLLLGRVVAIHLGRTSAGPLLFHRGEYGRIQAGDELAGRRLRLG